MTAPEATQHRTTAAELLAQHPIVLGWGDADDLHQATAAAQQDLATEADKYGEVIDIRDIRTLSAQRGHNARWTVIIEARPSYSNTTSRALTNN